MTEEQWLAQVEPGRMLAFLRDRASGRKLRLFACACCRQVWHSLTDSRCRAAVEQAERYADGLASKKSLTPLRVEARKAVRRQDIPYWRGRAFHACLNVVDDVPAHEVAEWAAQDAYGAVLCGDGDHQAASQMQAALLRDIFRPFRPVTLDPAWGTPLVVALAQAVYEERELPAGTLDPARLAVLADALEDAGCTNSDILAHLRGPGPHVRGCWAADLLLGKE
jgi:hypothetical protein